jgi:hypothetical protein
VDVRGIVAGQEHHGGTDLLGARSAAMNCALPPASMIVATT